MKIIKTDSEPDYVRDYYEFACEKLSSLSSNNSYSVIGLDQFDQVPSHPKFAAGKSEKKIFINYEHNLVHPSVPYYPIFGSIPVKGEDNLSYLVRIEQPNRLISSDFYLEYSNPNIENMKSCEQLSSLMKKVIYFPPILCEYSPDSEERSMDLLTSFYILNPEGRPRRKTIHDMLKSEIDGYTNIPMCFGQDLYDSYYKKAKVMVNVHQTDHHHTFEELRVLPALLNGMVIVAEDSPLKEKVPYHEYIIWAKYEDIVDVAKEAIENHESHYERIHGKNSGLRETIEQMRAQLDLELETAFKK